MSDRNRSDLVAALRELVKRWHDDASRADVDYRVDGDDFYRGVAAASRSDANDLTHVIKESQLIDKPYAYHRPSSDGLDKINRLREHFSEGERLIREVCTDADGKPTRQQSIALTNNEQTAMWAIKAVVFNDPKSELDVPPALAKA